MDALIRYLPILLSASLITFALAICSLFVATLFGALGAKGRLSNDQFGREYATVYIGIVRGIPDLVLILLVYYGFQRILNTITEDWLGVSRFELSTFWAGVLGIGFIYGAYLTETFRGAYLAVPQGQKEAAASLGLGRYAGFYKVVLPQFIRHAIPGYGNVFQVLIKSTAVVGVIGLNDLVGIANDAGKSAREPFIFLFFVLFMYLIFYYLVGIFFNWLERRYAEVGK